MLTPTFQWYSHNPPSAISKSKIWRHATWQNFNHSRIGMKLSQDRGYSKIPLESLYWWGIPTENLFSGAPISGQHNVGITLMGQVLGIQRPKGWRGAPADGGNLRSRVSSDGPRNQKKKTNSRRLPLVDGIETIGKQIIKNHQGNSIRFPRFPYLKYI